MVKMMIMKMMMIISLTMAREIMITFTIIISMLIQHSHEISTNHKMIQLCRHCEAKFMFNPRSTSTSLFANMTTLHHMVIYLFDSYLISNGFLRDEF